MHDLAVFCTGAAMDGAKCTAIKGFTFGALKLMDPSMIMLLYDEIYKIEPFIKDECGYLHFPTATKSEKMITVTHTAEMIELQNEKEPNVGQKGTQSVNSVLLVRFKIGDDNLETNAE